MDTMTRQLRSQVCLSSTIPPMAAADDQRASRSTPTSRDGNAGLAAGAAHASPTTRPTRTLIERDYIGTGTAPTITYPATADAARRRWPRTSCPTRSTPIFRYYAFNTGDAAAPRRRAAARR